MMHVLIAPVFEKALISIHAHNIVPLVFDIPKLIEHGHLSTNIAMTLARHLKGNLQILLKISSML